MELPYEHCELQIQGCNLDVIESSCSRSLSSSSTIFGRNAQDRDWAIGGAGFPTGET